MLASGVPTRSLKLHAFPSLATRPSLSPTGRIICASSILVIGLLKRALSAWEMIPWRTAQSRAFSSSLSRLPLAVLFTDVVLFTQALPRWELLACWDKTYSWSKSIGRSQFELSTILVSATLTPAVSVSLKLSWQPWILLAFIFSGKDFFSHEAREKDEIWSDFFWFPYQSSVCPLPHSEKERLKDSAPERAPAVVVSSRVNSPENEAGRLVIESPTLAPLSCAKDTPISPAMAKRLKKSFPFML